MGGRYRIVRQAGAGGMSVVYEALDLKRNAPVAVKSWRLGVGVDRRAHSRLEREAVALAGVRHPAIVPYVDHGSSPETGSYVVIEWIPGETLATRLAREPLTLGDSLLVASRLASGLSALHASGVVHRDMKPGNVLVPDGDLARPVIVDLGIAHVGSAVVVTGAGAQLGTPRYMAPEQIRNARAVTGKADVFGLGCILFECVTGRHAFEGVESMSVLARILFETPPLPSQLNPQLPASVDRLIGRLLAQEPGERLSAPDAERLIHEVSAGLGSHELSRAPRVKRLSEVPKIQEPTLALESERDRDSGAFSRPGRMFPAPPVHVLPQSTSTFVGRERDVEYLAGLLRSGTPLVTVWGAPGIGKTRLAVQTASALSRPGQGTWDAVVFVDLSEAGDVDDIVRILSRQAGVAIEPSSAPELAAARAVGALGRVLLVADRVELALTGFAAVVGAFARAARDVQILATSRVRICPPGALALELGPLPTTGAGAPSLAAKLLLDRVASSRPPGGRFNAAEVDVAERIATALEGVPLALELCAAQTPGLGLAGLLDRVARSSSKSGVLDLGSGAMRRAIGSSHDSLSESERRVFAQCAVFHGGFDLAAASAVSAAPVDVIHGVLGALREKSLLASVAEPGGRTSRFWMFPALREFAAERLREAPDAEGVFARHAAHYATLCDATGRGAGVPLDALEYEVDNLLAAADYACSEESAALAPGLSCLLALEPVMVARGANAGFRSLLDRALTRAFGSSEPTVPELEARARQIRARLDAAEGNAERAEAELAQVLRLAESSGDVRWLGRVNVDLGVILHFRRKLPEARSSYTRALDLLRGEDDRWGEGRCLGNLGALAHDEGDLSAAERLYREAIVVLEGTGDARQRANFIGNLALIEQETGRLAAAQEHFALAVSLLEPLRDARVLAIAVGNLGVLELEMGQMESALARFDRSRALLSGSGDRRSEALAESRAASALALLARFEEAEIRYIRGERRAATDALTREVALLARIFADIASARAAFARRADADAAKWLGRARSRISRTYTSFDGVRTVRAASDDVRALLRIAEPLLARLEAHGLVLG